MVLRGNYATHHDQNVLAIQMAQFSQELWNQSFVSRGERGNADDMDIILNGMAGDFAWSLKKGPNINIEAHIGECSGDHFGATVVAILAHFCD
jgi:hypothetical protein